MKNPTKAVRRSIWRAVQEWGRDLLDRALSKGQRSEDAPKDRTPFTEQHPGERVSREFPE